MFSIRALLALSSAVYQELYRGFCSRQHAFHAAHPTIRQICMAQKVTFHPCADWLAGASTDPSQQLDPSQPELTLEVGPISCVLSHTGQEDLRLADSPFLIAPAGGAVCVLVAASSAAATLHMTHTHAVSVTLQNPLIWGSPGVGIYLPAAGVHLGIAPGNQGMAEREWQDERAGSKAAVRDARRMVWLDCCKIREVQAEVKPPQRDSLDVEGGGVHAGLQPATPLQVLMAVAGVEVAIPARQWEALLGMGARLSSPLLPQLPAYPTAGLVSASSLLVHLSLGTFKAELPGGGDAGRRDGDAAGDETRLEASQVDISFEQRVGEVGSLPHLTHFLRTGVPRSWRAGLGKFRGSAGTRGKFLSFAFF